MSHKFCPRCGSSFATLKSATCPTCFARLIELDDETAAEITARRAQFEASDEYLQAKEEDDERFRHQSFQACVSIIFFTIVAVVVIVAAIVHARRYNQALRREAAAIRAQVATRTVPQAGVADVMPVDIAGFHREKMDQQADVSGTVSLIYHGAYAAIGSEAKGQPMVDVYAIATNRSTADRGRFRDLVKLLANAGAEQRSVVEVPAKPFLYEIVAPNGTTELRSFQWAWVQQVGGS